MKFLAAVVAVVIVFSAVPVFAGGGEAKKSCFQKISDSIEGNDASAELSPIMKSEKHKFRPILKKVTFFQNFSDHIKEGSAKAKAKSARAK
ncbi:hypothetical protein ACFL42_01320 [Candidatus Omnitrophota bacterium]